LRRNEEALRETGVFFRPMLRIKTSERRLQYGDGRRGEEFENLPARQIRLPIARGSRYAVSVVRLSGHLQQIDDISFALERPRVGLDEAMIDCNLADLAKLVFADTDISKAAR
jgi:hypothetical protein